MLWWFDIVWSFTLFTVIDIWIFFSGLIIDNYHELPIYYNTLYINSCYQNVFILNNEHNYGYLLIINCIWFVNPNYKIAKKNRMDF